MPCRNVLPKPRQKPHPPMWIACTNRDTIKVAARNGLGALAFSFIDPEEAQAWVEIYYDIIRSDECVPLGHTVNANIALVTGFSLDPRSGRGDPPRPGGLRVLRVCAQCARRPRSGSRDEPICGVSSRPAAHRIRPSCASLRPPRRTTPTRAASARRPTRDDTCARSRDVGVDQVIFIQQAGRNRHADICSSLELFAAEVMPEFAAEEADRQRRKAAELAPFIEAALARKQWMQPLADDEIPVVKASVKKAQTSGSLT